MKPKRLLASKLLQRWMLKSISLPVPVGKFPVGTRETYLARDESTLEDGPIRKIGLKIWYPAEFTSLPVETYFSDLEMTRMHSGDGPDIYAYLAKLKTHSQPNAPFAVTAKNCPVVIYSHGHSLTNRTNYLVCESLASLGYVVIAVGHTGEGFCTVVDGEKFPMNPAIMRHFREEMDEFIKKHKGMSIKKNPGEYIRLMIIENKYSSERTKVWTRDLQQVADWIQSREDPFLHGHLNTNHFGAFGHSFGGAVALRVMLDDQRFACGVNMDGGQFGGDFLDRKVNLPMMVLSSQKRGLQTGFHPDQKGIHWVEIPSAKHLNFSDGSIVYGSFPKWLGANGRIQGHRMIELMTTVLFTFFNRYLVNLINVDVRQVVVKFPEINYEYEEPEEKV